MVCLFKRSQIRDVLTARLENERRQKEDESVSYYAIATNATEFNSNSSNSSNSTNNVM
jgi:hypothetical protein